MNNNVVAVLLGRSDQQVTVETQTTPLCTDNEEMNEHA